jgi:Tol biopolymer transport system component
MSDRPRDSRTGRLAAAALALLLAAAGFVLAFQAFGAGRDSRATSAAGGQLVFVRRNDLWLASSGRGAGRQLTDGPGFYRDPAVSPDGRSVLAVRRTGRSDVADAELVLVPADGGESDVLNRDPWVALDPAWSPDGDRIAFAGSPGGPYGIYVANADGTGPRLIPGTDEIEVGHPVWSPDGSRIAFEARTGHPEPWDLHLAAPDGSGLLNLTNTPSQSEFSSSWSPTDRLAFVRRGPDGSGIFTMALNGADAQQVTAGPTDSNSTWSPDGTVIAFDRDHGADRDVYLTNPEGTDQRRITEPGGDESDPAWQTLQLEQPSLHPSPATAAPFPAAVVPTLTAEIPTGSKNGGALLFAEGSIWVAAPANDGTGGGELVRINPATNDVVARIQVAAVPTWEVAGGGIASGEGSIWLTGAGELPGGGFGAILQRVDPASNEVVATIELDGEVGYDVAVGKAAVWVLLAGRDGNTRVSRIDPSSNQVVTTVRLQHRWAHRILTTGAEVLVLEHRTSGVGGRSGVFTIIDAASTRIVESSEPALAGPAWDLAVWGDQVWTDAGGWELARVDPLTGAALGGIHPVLEISGSDGITAGEGGIWFVGYNSNSRNERPVTLNRADPEIGTIDVTAEIGIRGRDMAAGGGAVWLLRSDGTLQRFDLKPPPPRPDPAALEPFVAPLVARFMEARIEGSGAERFLTARGHNAWRSETSTLAALYSPEDLRYESFAIVSVDSLGDRTFQVGVQMFGAHLDGEDEILTEPLFEETLFIGPGETASGEPELLMVTGGRSEFRRS